MQRIDYTIRKASTRNSFVLRILSSLLNKYIYSEILDCLFVFSVGLFRANSFAEAISHLKLNYYSQVFLAQPDLSALAIMLLPSLKSVSTLLHSGERHTHRGSILFPPAGR